MPPPSNTKFILSENAANGIELNFVSNPPAPATQYSIQARINAGTWDLIGSGTTASNPIVLYDPAQLSFDDEVEAQVLYQDAGGNDISGWSASNYQTWHF